MKLLKPPKMAGQCIRSLNEENGMAKTQFKLILEPKLISKIVNHPEGTQLCTKQVVIYYGNFITKITKIFHTLPTVSVCVVTWATV